MSFLSESFRHLFSQKDEATKDKLGAYPERMHVRALPERRYLKTARIMTIATLMSLMLNVALAFIIMYIAPQMTTTITKGERNYLFQADKFFKEVKPIPNSTTKMSWGRLVWDAEIDRYVHELFTVVPDKNQMDYIWHENNFLSLATQSNKIAFSMWRQQAYDLLKQGINTEVWVHTIHFVPVTGLYEVIFDVFFLENANGMKRVCPCMFQNEACSTCLKAEAPRVERYKMVIRPSLGRLMGLANPYGLSLDSWHLLRLPIYDPNKPEEKTEAEWNDVRLAR